MERIGKRIAGSIVVLVATLVPAAAAWAQADVPAPGAPASAVSVDPPFVASGSFTPGVRQHLGIAAAAIQQSHTYRGSLSSTPVAPLPPVVASAGAILWTDVLVPAGFELGAEHRITVIDDVTGAVVAVSDFYVGADGTIHAFAPARTPAGTPAGSAGAARSGSEAPGAATGGHLARIASDPDAPAKLSVGLVALAALIVLTVHKRHDEMVGSS
jgi:hypothetical protein